jgi:hypothetical protein
MALLAVNVKGVFHPAARFNVHLNHALLDLAAFIDPVRHLVAVEVIGPRIKTLRRRRTLLARPMLARSFSQCN